MTFKVVNGTGLDLYFGSNSENIEVQAGAEKTVKTEDAELIKLLTGKTVKGLSIDEII